MLDIEAPPPRPTEVARAMSAKVTLTSILARGYREATLVFADLANLGELAAASPPEQVVEILDAVLGTLDRAAASHALSRVPVAGGAFAAVSGIPDPRRDHLEAAAEMALEASAAVARLLGRRGDVLGLRIGLHAGPVVAALDAGGVVRDLWGVATRVARAMEARAEPGRIQVSEPAARRLAAGYRLEPGSRGDALTLGVASRFLTGRR